MALGMQCQSKISQQLLDQLHLHLIIWHFCPKRGTVQVTGIHSLQWMNPTDLHIFFMLLLYFSILHFTSHPLFVHTVQIIIICILKTEIFTYLLKFLYC